MFFNLSNKVFVMLKYIESGKVYTFIGEGLLHYNSSLSLCVEITTSHLTPMLVKKVFFSKCQYDYMCQSVSERSMLVFLWLDPTCSKFQFTKLDVDVL